jgi:hypothetical protein
MKEDRDYTRRKIRRLGRIIASAAAVLVYVVMLVAPVGEGSELTSLVIAGFVFFGTRILFFLVRRVWGWQLRRRFEKIHRPVLFLGRRALIISWSAALSISVFSVFRGIGAQARGARFALTYIVPLLLIGLMALLSERSDSVERPTGELSENESEKEQIERD